jgi:hypothetical protein
MANDMRIAVWPSAGVFAIRQGTLMLWGAMSLRSVLARESTTVMPTTVQHIGKIPKNICTRLTILGYRQSPRDDTVKKQTSSMLRHN